MPDHRPEALPLEALATLLGGPAGAVSVLGGGRNSRVLKVTDAHGMAFTAKAYHLHPDDGRDRLGVEFGALRFLWSQGVRVIPQPLAMDAQASMGLMEFIEGTPVAEPTDADLGEAVEFLLHLQYLASVPEAEPLPTASEACFSLLDIDTNVQARLERLRGVAHPDLVAFLNQDLLPAWEAIRAESHHHWQQADWPVAEPLPSYARTLSPSDFGFHNALRRNGHLVFLDFEYFGWDDPAKTLVDFLLHPAMNLSVPQGRRFAEHLLDQWNRPGLRQRARWVYPLFGIKWCLILLNEFLPGPLHRRQFATPQDPDPRDRQATQLHKARLHLRTLLDHHAHFPYFHDAD